MDTHKKTSRGVMKVEQLGDVGKGHSYLHNRAEIRTIIDAENRALDIRMAVCAEIDNMVARVSKR